MMCYYVGMYKYLYLTTLLLSIFSIGIFTNAQTTSCLSLKVDLNKGDSGNPVLILQNFLKSSGYLLVSPSGYFGSATQMAVKKLQSANSIFATGNAGVLTRALIQDKTCMIKLENDTSGVSAPTISNFISPKTGEYLKIGDTINVAWNVNVNYPHDIILEYPNGSGAGYIATSLSGENSYKWEIGNIYNAGSLANENVATGTYRIHIRKINSNSVNNDPISGLFILTEPRLSINSLSQSVITANDKQVVVVFGSGFDLSSTVRFDDQNGIPAHNLYTSPDGSVIVFSVTSSVSAGLHRIIVTNAYGMFSNSLSVSIVK